MNIVASTVIYLNDKVDARMRWSDDIIKKLIHKIEALSDTQIRVSLMWWQNNLRNLTASNGKKYIDVSDGQKILLIVSDLFGFAKDWRNLVERPFLETTLDNLKVDKLIRVSDFYNNLIWEKESLPLYVKKDYDYQTMDISSYGQLIYQIDKVFSQSLYLTDMRVSLNEALEDIYKKIKSNFDEKIRSVDLCESLINDLVCLDLDLLKKIEVEDQAIEETNEASEKKKDDEGECDRTMGTNINYSIFRITPEGLWVFKEEKVFTNLFIYKTKADYSFSKTNEEEIKQRLDSGDPYMVTMPEEYYRQCMAEDKNTCRIGIKNILSEKKYISLADYYMYLWFNNTKASERKDKKLAFIEFYDNDLYVSGYAVNESGEDYRKGFSGLRIHQTKSEGAIKKLVKAEGIYSEISWESILCFKVFTANKHIDKKLINIGVSKVVDAWENILKADNNTIGNNIRNMITKR